MPYSLENIKWKSNSLTWSFSGNNYGNSFTKSSVEAAFSEWSKASGLNFTEVADSSSSSIRVSFADLSPSTSGKIGYTSYSYSNGQFNAGVSVQLEDPAKLSLVNGVYSGYVSTFHQVALHEIGHALGLDHDSDNSSVMYAVAGASNPVISRSDMAGIRAEYQDVWADTVGVTVGNPGKVASHIQQTDTTIGASSSPVSQAYSGPVDYLSSQYAGSGDHSVAIRADADAPFSFIVTGAGNDAIEVTSGNNVISAGSGSNFLTGGSGTDTFFMDGRDTAVTWDTISNFHHGDMMTLWGFVPGVSRTWWDNNISGAENYKGATMRIDMHGNGNIDASVTFADMSITRAQQMTTGTGIQGNLSYLMIVNV